VRSKTPASRAAWIWTNLSGLVLDHIHFLVRMGLKNEIETKRSSHELKSKHSENLSLFLYFLLDQKVTKNQGFIKMLAVLSQRYLLAIQGMKEHNKS